MQPEPQRVAARLGLDERTITRLGARGYLCRLALTEPQIRARLYHAHLAYLLARRAGRKAGGRAGTGTLSLLVAMCALFLPHSANALATGEKSVLVVLATFGPQPYTVADVERTMRAAEEFLRNTSLGQVRLRADVTPWLAAFTGNPGCGGLANSSLDALVAPARLAAQRAGYDASRYDDLIYAIADSHCGFQGVAWGDQVMLTRRPTLRLVVHELGHAFGLAHAQSSSCAENRLTCGLDDTGDPFSPMGSGMLDFSVYEKGLLGWIHPQSRVVSDGRHILAPPTIKTSLAQALIVRTAQGIWWIEYRSRPFRGLLVRLVYRTAIESPLAPPAVLITNPTKTGQPWVGPGETYRIPHSMRVTLLHAETGRAEVHLS
jgi:hypothetical protein